MQASTPSPAAEPRADLDSSGQALDDDAHTLDLLLRSPGALVARLRGAGAPRTLAACAALAFAGHLLYGLVIGSFSGGVQWWAAPLKVVMGTLLSGAVCFPSLYIFVTVAGARARGVEVLGLLLALLALLASTATLLAGFAPVAWVFTQSSTHVGFAGALHLAVWAIAIVASARILRAGTLTWRASSSVWALPWLAVFVLTALQMTTTLRPIVGTSSRFIEPERKFFLEHWLDAALERDEHAAPASR